MRHRHDTGLPIGFVPIMLLAAVACGGEITAPDSEVIGMFTLNGFEDRGLPVFMGGSDEDNLELTSGVITFTPDSFRLTFEFKVGGPSTITTHRTIAGPFYLAGDQVWFPGQPFSGEILGSLLELKGSFFRPERAEFPYCFVCDQRQRLYFRRR